MGELLPCPFCGSKKMVRGKTLLGTHNIICFGCSCQTMWEDSPEQATDSWNHRTEPTPPPADDEVAALVKEARAEIATVQAAGSKRGYAVQAMSVTTAIRLADALEREHQARLEDQRHVEAYQRQREGVGRMVGWTPIMSRPIELYVYDAINAAWLAGRDAAADAARAHNSPIPGRADDHTPCYFAQGHECTDEIVGAIESLQLPSTEAKGEKDE